MLFITILCLITDVVVCSAPNGPSDPSLDALVWQYGYHMDVRGAVSPGCQMVNQTGWWRPWVL